MLGSALKAIASEYPHNCALRVGDATLSYEDLWRRASTYARDLTRLGIVEGDRVAILADNGIESVVAIWGILECRAICIYLNDQLKPDGLEQILDDAQAQIVLCHPEAMKKKLPSTARCHVLDLVSLPENALQRVDSRSDIFPSGTGTIANIIYTSGSTGTPKGVCLTHDNLLSVAKMAADGYRISPSDSYLMVVPLHYIHGLMILMALQLRGASIEFMNSFMFPSVVTKRLRENRITGFSGVPYHFSALIDKGGFLDTPLPDLRWVGVTGGTITPERLKAIRAAKPELEVHISYGQTECSPRITLLDPTRIDGKPTSVGSVAEGLHVEFLDDEGKPVPEGEVGELVVSGPNVMAGYWDDEENTTRVIDAQGRLLTGDLAYRDEDGDIYIKGRKQAMIKSAGERIFPEELEAILNAHDEVSDSAVVGVSDPLYGQRVEAHVVFEESAQGDEATDEMRLKRLKDHCLSQVPFARAPRHFHVWKTFPLKANGKTDKQRIIAETAAHA